MITFGTYLFFSSVAAIQLGSVLACTCPTTWVRLKHNTRCYFSSSNNEVSKKTYFEARERCQADGGDLVIISDDSEYRYIRGDIHNSTDTTHFWVGACWSGNPRGLIQLGGSEIPVGLSHGTKSSPPAFGVMMNGAIKGVLYDDDPNHEKHYICEKDPCSDSSYTSYCKKSDSTNDFVFKTTTESTHAVGSTAHGTTNDDKPPPVSTADTPKTSYSTLYSTTESFRVLTSEYLTPDNAAHENGKSKIPIWIGIGVAVLVVIAVMLIVIICIVRRHGLSKGKKHRDDVATTNNLSMKTKDRIHTSSKNIPASHTKSADKLQSKESGYAEVDVQPYINTSNKAVDDTNDKYDDTVRVDIGVAHKVINAEALYASPSRKKRGLKKENIDRWSEGENTQTVDNSLYDN